MFYRKPLFYFTPIIIMFFVWLILPNVVLAANEGIFTNLTQCRASGDCSLCDFLSVFVNISRWILSVMGGLALILFIWAGQGYIMSFGNPEKVEASKKTLTGTVFGIVIILAAWTLVNILLSLILPGGSTKIFGKTPWSTLDDMCPLKVPGIVSGTTGVAGTLDEQTARNQLQSYGYKFNNDPCSSTKTSGCTNLAGLRPETMAELQRLAATSKLQNLIINGGTEPDPVHVQTGTSHVAGYKFDLAATGELTKYIQNNFTSAGKRGSYDRYTIGNSEYVWETDKGHWDVCVACK